jgi:hypothetical protein
LGRRVRAVFLPKSKKCRFHTKPDKDGGFTNCPKRSLPNFDTFSQLTFRMVAVFRGRFRIITVFGVRTVGVSRKTVMMRKTPSARSLFFAHFSARLLFLEHEKQQ